MKYKVCLYFLIVALTYACKSSQTNEILVKPTDEYSKEIEAHRTKYLKDFLNDSRAPLDSADLKDVHFFEVDADYRLHCNYKEATIKEAFDMATYSGMVKPYQVYGYLECKVKENDIKLALYQSTDLANIPAYASHLFLPFKDITNGDKSYGGGRYIDVSAGEIKDGKIEIDFNKAYNPWCAYSDGYNCPIPPIANHLDISIKAGEAIYTGAKKQRPQ